LYFLPVRGRTGGEVVFTSDFGLTDPYVGEVKGVILACEPGARVTDLTHGIEAHNLTSAAFVLRNGYRYFATGAVHLVVVDPGVGSERDLLVVTTRNYRFAGPDNGVLYEAAASDGIESIHALDVALFLEEIAGVYARNPVVERILGAGVSPVFHGRDLFAPLAAYLARRAPMPRGGAGKKAPSSRAAGGAAPPLFRFGRPRDTMAKVEIGEPLDDGDGLLGRVVYIDGFGSLVSNIRADSVGPGDEIFVKSGGAAGAVGRLKRTYADAGSGAALALIGSTGHLEIAVNRGNAKARFGAAVGDGVYVLKKRRADGGEAGERW
jgi:S-adenosyl-L-methionine hydrolase (adenosine-forming)